MNMRNESDQPSVPGYFSIKEAAKLLGLSPSRVYEYVEDGRLSSVRAAHVILIPVEEVKTFKPNISGRPRKSIPQWRISPEDNKLLSTTILVQMRDNQAALMRKLEKVKQKEQYLFPGTVSRFVIKNDSVPSQVEIILIWRSSVAPTQEVQEQALDEFRHVLADVLDWNTAQYNYGQVLMHT